MKFGLYVSPQFRADDDLDDALAGMAMMVRAARESGFESIWVPHHYVVHPMRMFQPHELLARLSTEAGGMRCGTAILLLSMMNPVQVAEQAASLDWMTSGGYVLAAGLGYRPEEFQSMGVEMQDRAARLTEAVELIRRLWTEERVTHKGRFFTVEDVGLSLHPRRPEGCPIWLGGSVPAAVRRAARIGDAWLASFTAPISELSELRGEFLGAGGSNNDEQPICRECFVDTDDATAMAASRDALIGKYAVYDSWKNDDLAGRPFEERFEEVARDGFLIGGVDTVRDAVARYRDELGATTLILRMNWPGLSLDRAVDSIRRFSGVAREFT